MNSLESYKSQVYNIGSPTPSPSRTPLSRLPPNLEEDFEFTASTETITNSGKKVSACKIPKFKASSAVKRKAVDSFDIGKASPKRLKMISQEQFNEFRAQSKKDTEESFSKAMTEFMKQSKLDSEKAVSDGMKKFDSRLDGLSKKLDKVIKDNSESKDEVKAEFVGLKEQVVKLKTSVDDQNLNFENRLSDLEGNVKALTDSVHENSTQNLQEIKEAIIPLIKDELIDTVKEEVKKEMMQPLRSTWIAIQKQNVWDHEHALLVFNYDAANNSPTDSARDLLKNKLKISDENMAKIIIKQAYRLGRGSNGRVAPLFIKFGHPSERGLVLSHAKNLGNSKISVEKSVPKNYEEAFKKFKEESFKLRNMPGLDLQVQIVFDGHLMHLRTKTKDTDSDKFHYTIHSTFDPPMEPEVAVEKSSLKIPPGTRPSPKPDSALLAKINASVYMSIKGFQDNVTDDTMKRNVLEYLKEEHREKVNEIQVKKKGLLIMFCDTWENAKLISDSYKKFMEHNVSFTLFSEKNPIQNA